MAIQACAAKVTPRTLAWRHGAREVAGKAKNPMGCIFSIYSVIFLLRSLAKRHWPPECVSSVLSGGRDEMTRSIQFVSASPHQGYFSAAVSPSFVEMQKPLFFSSPIPFIDGLKSSWLLQAVELSPSHGA